MPFIEDSLVYLFNTSLETSQFPDPWKIARVPIFKDGDKTEKSNYRPISVLPVVSRLFEKLVFIQLYQCLNDNCFINSNLSGFRELHSGGSRRKSDRGSTLQFWAWWVWWARLA